MVEFIEKKHSFEPRFLAAQHDDSSLMRLCEEVLLSELIYTIRKDMNDMLVCAFYECAPFFYRKMAVDILSNLFEADLDEVLREIFFNLDSTSLRNSRW